MLTVHLVLLILAIISFFVAALRIEPARVNLTALGLLLWALATVVAR